ncbi:MAG: thioredoxin domain-containing protein [Acidobacteria bacterium]|nr:thioredoxin domain-containing protein [Acidobacteriota bacterium]
MIPRAAKRLVATACCLLLPACGGLSADDTQGTLPGAPPFDAQTLQKLRAAWARRNPAYKPRTRHLRPDGSPQYTNRLILESSPYLLQHAHNPVNWRPWGTEAFDAAKKLGRPLLLSVGYSTCHWCHVMEEESFEDVEIARYLNENYITVKVDREERPDIDTIYMTAVQEMTGSGGWPMTVWLTPDRKPFFGGTYFPPRDGDRGATTGFLTLLRKLKEVYAHEPERVAASSAQLASSIQRALTTKAGEDLPQARVLQDAFRFFQTRFDPIYGGARGAPKFPSSLPVRFLLRYYRRTSDQQALQMVTRTLEKMAEGGIHDHLGGGFHRYSTDARWQVPHFEKMLYDNALLAVAYLEAYQATGREDFAQVARSILRYVERDMTSPEGAFYSATDADSPSPDGTREEGWFFTWTPAEIEAALSAEDARMVKAYFAVTPQGNFEGRNILHTPKSLEEVARELSLPPAQVRAVVNRSRERLYQARSKRPSPLRDEKILTAWNGLMISAYAKAALVLGEESYARRAERAAAFVLQRLRRNGLLLRSYKDGMAQHDAYLDDYVFLTAGLLDLYEATGNLRWFREALALDRVVERHFEDAGQGGFFLTGDNHEPLLARAKPNYDGAEPSGGSVEVMNLLRFNEFTTDDRYWQRAERAFKAVERLLVESPAALSEMLPAVDFRLDTPKEIVIVTPQTRAGAESLLARLRATFVPNRILAVVSQGPELATQAKLIPLLEGKVAQKGKATAYVCEKRVCELPTTDPDVFTKQIRKVEPLSGGTARPLAGAARRRGTPAGPSR